MQIYSDNNIPPMDTRNMMEEVKNQIKATSYKVETWECEALDVNFIWCGGIFTATITSLVTILAYKSFVIFP